MSSDLEKQAEFIAKMIAEDRKKLKEWVPSPEYYKMLEGTRKAMEEAKLLGQPVKEAEK